MMLCLMLVVFGMGFLGKRGPQYGASLAMARATQARALAEAGLEDARVKLDKDLFFPPPGDQDQLLFTYTEAVNDDFTGQLVGYYAVTVDTRWAADPLDPPNPKHPSVITVWSKGLLGPDPLHPAAQSSLLMEIDVHEGTPPDEFPSIPNKVTNIYEL